VGVGGTVKRAPCRFAGGMGGGRGGGVDVGVEAGR
jgi:hypothetical protein